MADDLIARIRALPAEAFCEPQNQLEALTPLERLRWLQQTAWFIRKHKGAAQSDHVPDRRDETTAD